MEWSHFRIAQAEVAESVEALPCNARSNQIMSLWCALQSKMDGENFSPTSMLGRLANRLKWCYLRIKVKRLLHLPKLKDSDMLSVVCKLQGLFLLSKQTEIEGEIADLETESQKLNAEALKEEMAQCSMDLFRNKLWQKYKDMKPVQLHCSNDINKNAAVFLNRYPVVLSTTFSATTSISDVVYDYIIMDEASQVSAETGLLALTCAKNAVIVGDNKQLPNVVADNERTMLNTIFEHFTIAEGYNVAKYSFLDSVCGIVAGISQTLLREHYRCHPRIINFCNQKFYGGNLVIMTQDNGERNVMSAIKTVPGNHCRGHYNQREIDAILHEAMPRIEKGADVGIITPYNAQVDQINAQYGSCVATVHKYQGRERNVIIFSVADDRISSFSDDAKLLNVAISRAKDQFFLVVTGNEQETRGNITDLIDYIAYNVGEVVDSKIYSIFDNLFRAYSGERMRLRATSRKVSEYESENLTFEMIATLLEDNESFSDLGVLCHYPLRFIVRDSDAMTTEERLYVSRQGTHVDFLIYSIVSKRPVLVVETDGYSYHKAGTRQHDRDKLKDSVLQKYGIPIIRLSTTASREQDKLLNALKHIRFNHSDTMH